MSLTKGILEGINYNEYLKDKNESAGSAPGDDGGKYKKSSMKESTKPNDRGGFEQLKGNTSKDIPKKLKLKKSQENNGGKSNVNNGIADLTKDSDGKVVNEDVDDDDESDPGSDLEEGGTSTIRRKKGAKRRAMAGRSSISMMKRKNPGLYKKYKRMREKLLKAKAKAMKKYGRKAFKHAKKTIK